MASKLSTVCELFKANEASAPQTPIAITANTAFYLPAVGRTMIIGITPAATGYVTVTKGNGVSAMNDITFAVTKDKISFIQLDTSAFEFIGDPTRNWGKDADGDIAYIKLTSTAAGTCVAVNAL